jgi:hypothetical protein
LVGRRTQFAQTRRPGPVKAAQRFFHFFRLKQAPKWRGDRAKKVKKVGLSALLDSKAFEVFLGS